MLPQKRISEAAPIRMITAGTCCCPLQQSVQYDALHACEPAAGVLDRGSYARGYSSRRPRLRRSIREPVGREPMKQIGRLSRGCKRLYNSAPWDSVRGWRRQRGGGRHGEEVGSGGGSRLFSNATLQSSPSRCKQAALPWLCKVAVLLTLDGCKEMQLMDDA
jgi:hypothetical protein